MPKKAIAPKAQSLQVPDCESEDAFMKKAKQVWRAAHPQPKKKTGRPSAKQQVFEVCEEILNKNGQKFPLSPLTGATPYRRWSSVGDWVDAIKKQTGLSQNTIEKHLTAWLLKAAENSKWLNWPLMRHVFRHNPECAQEWHLFHQKMLKALPEAARRLAKKEKVLRPHFTYNEMCALDHSFDEVVKLVETGLSRKAILRKIKNGAFPGVRIEDFALSAPSRK